MNNNLEDEKKKCDRRTKLTGIIHVVIKEDGKYKVMLEMLLSKDINIVYTSKLNPIL